MNNEIYIKKKLASSWFASLQQIICYEFQKIEIDFGKKTGQKPKYFKKKSWTKSNNVSEGGGSYSIIKNGLIFDSVGVNFSEVSGKFNKKFRSEIPGAKKISNYWATGISVVAHMKNPKIPAMHFNTRFITTTKNWFGGGIDATPCIIDNKERKIFHEKIRLMCNKHNKNYYPSIKNGVIIIFIYLIEKKQEVLVEYFLIIKKIIGKKILILSKMWGYVFLIVVKLL